MDDMFDVYDSVSDVIVSVDDLKISAFSRAKAPHFICSDCIVKITTLNNRLYTSCCGGKTTTDWTTTYRENFIMHLQQHVAMGHDVPEDAWDLQLQ